MRRLTRDERIAQIAQAQPGHVWDLSGAPKDAGAHAPWFAACPEHGPWKTAWDRLQRGHGCPRCAGNAPLSREGWAERATEVHGGKYQYPVDEWPAGMVTQTKVPIVCEVHGVFKQTMNVHVHRGAGCPECAAAAQAAAMAYGAEGWAERAREAHGGKYEYPTENWPAGMNARTRVPIQCEVHGVFEQNMSAHVFQGSGCPECALEASDSKGVTQIMSFLSERGIRYQREVRFDTCRNSQPLPFDFLVTGTNVLIEYQGEQHYKVARHWGGKAGLKQRQLHDQIKRNWCKANGFRLIEIRYDEDIEARLEKELGQKDGHG